MDQGSNFTMAKRSKFDLFAYIFNRDGEEDEPTTELQEDVPLMNPTVKSDEDDASNSRAAVIKQGDQPRRVQPDQLQEPKIERREFDIFNYIFNRDGEEDEPTTETQYSLFVDLTVDSDEAGASNSTAAVIQQDQPQSSSRQPRRTQTAQLPEPATDSEEEQDEDEDIRRGSILILEETSSEDRSQKSR